MVQGLLVGRSDLTDAAWSRIAVVVAGNGRSGKQWRGVAARFEKRADNYRAMLTVASLTIWLA